MSQQLTNDQFYQKFGNSHVWAAGWGMWRVQKDNISRPDNYYTPTILQMVQLEIINNKTIIQDTMLGTKVGQNPLQDTCSGDSGEIKIYELTTHSSSKYNPMIYLFIFQEDH